MNVVIVYLDSYYLLSFLMQEMDCLYLFYIFQVCVVIVCFVEARHLIHLISVDNNEIMVIDTAGYMI